MLLTLVSIQIQETGFLNVHDVKNKSINEQGHAVSKHFSKISEIFLSSVSKITDLKSLLKSELNGKDAFDISF